MEAIIVAVIAAIGAAVVAKIQTAQGKKNTDKVLSKIQTNHGREPYEYLEQIADVHAAVDTLAARVDAYVRLNERAHEEIRLELRELVA